MEYLKIKEDVDLRELEKFGFEFEDLDEDGESDSRYAKYIHMSDNNGVIVVMVSDRVIGAVSDYDSSFIDDFAVVFDLMQAGLVEKVVE